MRPASKVVREVAALGRLPWRVTVLYLRCLLLALRLRDTWSLRSATRPHELVRLLEIARTRRRVVELGTGTAWTTLALVAADRHRRVTTYDPNVMPNRERYVALAAPAMRARIEFVQLPGEAGPSTTTPVDLVFIDSWHSQAVTSQSFRAWEPSLRPHGIVAFHDYGSTFPGIQAAIEELGLDGAVFGNLYVWEKQADAERYSESKPT